MQSILFLVYISIPLTIGVRNYQNSMIGMFNSGVPKVPNSQNIYDLYNNGKKKGTQVLFQKINEDEPPPEPSMENQDLANPDHQELAAHFDLRRQNSRTTEPPKLNLDFPIPGGHVSDYNPYPSPLRQGANGDEGIYIDSPSSSESFGQYFPVPPFSQGRVENDIIIQQTGEKDMFIPRGENDDPIVEPKEYSSPPIERAAVREKYNGEMVENIWYNGESNGFNGGNNGHKGENNDDNQDMKEDNKSLTPTEKSGALIGTSLDQDSKQQELLETYKRITNTLNGKVIEKDPLGYIGRSNGVEELISVGYNGGSNGLHGGSNGFNGGSNDFDGVSNGFNGGTNDFDGGSNGFNRGKTGYNGGLNEFEGNNGVKKAVRQGYNVQYTGMKARNNGYNGYNSNNGENIEYYNKYMPAYTKRMKGLPPPEKSLPWTNSVNTNL